MWLINNEIIADQNRDKRRQRDQAEVGSQCLIVTQPRAPAGLLSGRFLLFSKYLDSRGDVNNGAREFDCDIFAGSDWPRGEGRGD